jgi:hypothetical protein
MGYIDETKINTRKCNTVSAEINKKQEARTTYKNFEQED